MEVKKPKARDIDEYIAGFPKDIQKILEQVRATIKKAAPEAEERISYEIPAFYLHDRYLVYFAAFKAHIGFYPTPAGTDAFKKALSAYKTGKGSVQFPLDKPIPLKLITDIVKFKAKENLLRSKIKEK
jgi:uncharacterized protein YdhG (YjbR/CyaY superfamily)